MARNRARLRSTAIRSADRRDGRDQPDLTAVALFVIVFLYLFGLMHLFSVVGVPACQSNLFLSWHVATESWPLFGSLSLVLVLLFFWNSSVLLDTMRSYGSRRLSIAMGSFNAIAVLTMGWILWHQVHFLERERFWEEATGIGWNSTPNYRSDIARCDSIVPLIGVWKVEELSSPQGIHFPPLEVFEFFPDLTFIAYRGAFSPPRRGRYSANLLFDDATVIYVSFMEPFRPLADTPFFIWEARMEGSTLTLERPPWFDSQYDAFPPPVSLRLRRLDESHSRQARGEALKLGVVDWFP